MWVIGLTVLLAVLPSSNGQCQDRLSICDQLQPVCIGSVIAWQLDQITTVANLVDNSSIPILEESLPLIRDNLPILMGTLDETSQGTTSTRSPDEQAQIDKELQDALPLLKESLPLIRESLPLLRDSLPLIRSILDPLYGMDNPANCKKKSVCKTCKECPKLRQSVQTMIEYLCPYTCRTCNDMPSIDDIAVDLLSYFT